MKDLIIAVDFDGTCVAHEFPKVGREIGAPRVLKRLTDAGAKLILWTMRSNGRGDVDKDGAIMENPNPLTDAVEWFAKHDIPLWGVQRNPEQDDWTSSPKAYAKLYIDDAALGCPLKLGLPGERPHVDWEAVEKLLFPDPTKPLYMVDYSVLKDGILTTGRCTPHVWAPYQPSTGRVDHDFEQYDDQLGDLVEGWVWKKFNLVPADE